MQKTTDLEPALLDSFTKQKYCDVTFFLKESKSNKWTNVEAHKAVLASVSDVFETMFFGEIVQNDGVKKEAEIKIEDIDAEVFKSLLGFIYGKQITFDCAELAHQFLVAADKYNCSAAKNFIEEYILEDVDAHNAITYYETANMMGLKALKKLCLEVFQENTMEVLYCPSFENAKPETLHAIFNLECCTINSETNFVWALERYIKFNKLSDPKIAEKVRPALSCIRFLTLDKKELARTPLLTEEEKKSVFNKNLDENQGLSINCTERGISGTMKMMQAVQPYFSDKFCSRCVFNINNANHAFWLCDVNEENFNSTLKKIYDKYNHTVLSEYKALDVKKVYKPYKVKLQNYSESSF